MTQPTRPLGSSPSVLLIALLVGAVVLAPSVAASVPASGDDHHAESTTAVTGAPPRDGAPPDHATPPTTEPNDRCDRRSGHGAGRPADHQRCVPSGDGDDEDEGDDGEQDAGDDVDGGDGLDLVDEPHADDDPGTDEGADDADPDEEAVADDAETGAGARPLATEPASAVARPPGRSSVAPTRPVPDGPTERDVVPEASTVAAGERALAPVAASPGDGAGPPAPEHGERALASSSGRMDLSNGQPVGPVGVQAATLPSERGAGALQLAAVVVLAVVLLAKGGGRGATGLGARLDGFEGRLRRFE